MTVGRVTNNLLQMSTLGDIKNNNRDLLELQQKLTTGKDINTISDNPLGVNRVLDYDLTITENDQFVKNLDTGRSELGVTDNSLDSLHAMIIRAKTIALSQINGTASQETRAATAIEISQILKEMVAVSNSQIGNSFIFAGTNTTIQPFDLVGDEVVYNGNDSDRLAAISKDVSTATNIPGSRAFGIFQNKIESSFNLNPSLQEKIFFETEIEGKSIPAGFSFALKDTPLQNIIGKELIITRGQNQGVSVRVLDYDPATKAVKVETQKFPVSLVSGTKLAVVQAPTKISELNQGKGISLGHFLGNIGPRAVTVDLSKAANISDIKDIIESSFEGKVEVSFTSNGQGFALKNISNETITIKEEGRNILARELGFLTIGVSKEIPPGTTLNGQNITPVVSINSTLISLNSGAGINNLGFRIKNGSKEHIFDTNDMEGLSTVGDLLNIINTANLDVDAVVNDAGTGILIRGRSSGKGVSIDNVMAIGKIEEKLSDTQMKIDSSAYTSEPEGLVGTQILITNPNGKVQSRIITAFDGSIATIDSPGDFSKDATIEIFSSRRFLGNVKSATLNSLTDTGAFSNAKNILIGGILKITEGKNAGAVLKITGGDKDSVFFNNPNNLVLDETSTYEILTGTANSLGIDSFNTGAKTASLRESSDLSLDSFEITYGPSQIKTIVDVSKAVNMQDVIDAITKATNNSIIATIANGNAIKLEDSRTSPTLQNAITINDIGSSTTAADLGILGVDGSAGKEYIGSDLKPRSKETNIYTALYDLIQGLRNNDYNLLNNAGKSIDASLNILLDARAEVGARLNRFDLSKNRLADQTDFLKELRSNTIDADYIDTVFQFNNKKDVVDASLKAVGALLKTSLLDYLQF
jgi:flagellin-like hook-associated protein FlgL